MARPELIAVLGLGFGDCGKGLFTDHLARLHGAHTVVRFNGGAQAGHNVVLPDGRQHTFSQFGAATFVPGVATLLAFPVVVHPGALLVEHAYLQRAGVDDALQRLTIDGRCRVNTPFHQAAGRLRELARGHAAHGSCGVGVGETVRHGLAFPEQILRYGDLVEPRRALAKLDATRLQLLHEFDHLAGSNAIAQELALLRDAQLARLWLDSIAPLLRAVAPASIEQVGTRLQRHGAVVFEGAQGVLLDEWRGFHPHTTWSTIHTDAVELVARDAGLAGPVRQLGVLRSYLTRHGNGPLPTFDAALAALAEPHNGDASWQGVFRRGQPDQLLLQYALEVVGKLDGLLVSHLDVFERGARLKWCDAYDVDGQRIERLAPGPQHDLAHQQTLTALLQRATPLYAPQEVGCAQALVERFEAVSNLPVVAGSYGPTHDNVRSAAWQD